MSGLVAPKRKQALSTLTRRIIFRQFPVSGYISISIYRAVHTSPLSSHISSSTYHFFTVAPSSLFNPTFTRQQVMGDESESFDFHANFVSALQDYEKQTGIPLAKHPLAEQLQNCYSVESVTAVLQEQAQGFRDFRGSDRIMELLKSAVSVLCKLSTTTGTPGGVIGLVCRRKATMSILRR